MIDYVDEYIKSRLAEEYIRRQKPVTRAEQESILKYIENIYGGKSNKNLDNFINDSTRIKNCNA